MISFKFFFCFLLENDINSVESAFISIKPIEFRQLINYPINDFSISQMWTTHKMHNITKRCCGRRLLIKKK